MKAIFIPLGLILLFGSGMLLVQPKRSPAAFVLLTVVGILCVGLAFATGIYRFVFMGTLVLLGLLGLLGWRQKR